MTLLSRRQDTVAQQFVKDTALFVRDGARFKNKLMGVMVYFQPAKNKHQSISQIRFPECRK